MKKQVKNWAAAVAAITIVLAGGVAMANNGHHDGANNSQRIMQNINLAEYMKEQDQIMAKMMKEMQNIPASGMASIDFLAGMIPHHQAAIEMSESLLKYGGEHKAIKQLAEEVIRVQSVEIAEMEKMMQDLKSNGQVDKEKEAAYSKAYNTMLHGSMSHDIPHDMTSPNSVDQAFAEGMIMHHEIAVDMSRAIAGHTDHTRLKEMAQEMINVQLKEISQMRALIKAMQA